jgi:small subunit ribosomal protein S5
MQAKAPRENRDRDGNRDGGKAPKNADPNALAAQALATPEGEAAQPEWQERVIQIRRVTKVVKGGKKMSFRAVVIVGNGKGTVGLGIGKSGEVIGAIQKAVSAAKKSMINVATYKHTIPHPVRGRAGASFVQMRPASDGTGIIAGGAARVVIELAGVGNILSKSLGSNSPLNVARATIEGLTQLRTFSDIADDRGISVTQMLALN